MEHKILDKIKTTLKSIVLKNQNTNLLKSNVINGLKFEKNTVYFTLELLTEQLKESQEIKKIIENKLLNVKEIQKVEIILTAHNTKKESNNNSQNSLLKPATYIIAVASGKGGVGKSTTSINIALSLSKLKYNVGILDADIYGPSLPKLTGISNKPKSSGNKIIPHNAFGLQAMSIGYLVPEDAATIWRGPMVMSAIEQLLRDVDWQGLDILIIDMPPGTGDAQLTLSQRVKLDGAIIVSTPQDLSLIDARKGLNMFKKVNVPILGIIENMSYFLCSNCKTKHPIFGNGGAKKEAEKLGIPFLDGIPLDIKLRTTSDEGVPIVEKEPDHFISKQYISIGSRVIETVIKNKKVSPIIIQ
ncbi:Mrp/NBP35 family ATP-binding protein [Alphaproteobacteria bacterium]|nr:Mrp/NBP35 family ATP-binding protein [Alphaproteobacteria bacterium]MDC1022935.1 Mrp/NBP35 family ATP-binding protein [Alphaproteobacteria bacterium]